MFFDFDTWTPSTLLDVPRRSKTWTPGHFDLFDVPRLRRFDN
jgi:hypothetical protein